MASEPGSHSAEPNASPTADSSTEQISPDFASAESASWQADEWRLLDLSSPDSFENMAIEEAVLHAVGRGDAPPTLRLWQNDNAVIIGYFQSASQEADLDACRANNTAVVRRLSGGGAVYHDAGNVNYSLFIPERDPRVGGPVLESYRALCQGVILGLADLGFAAQFAPINDVAVGDLKVSGTAQTRRFRAVLHHGTLMLDVSLDVMGRVLRIHPEYLAAKGVTELAARVSTLKRLGREVSVAEAKSAIADGYARSLGVRFRSADLTPAEKTQAAQLLAERYHRPEWNLSR